MRSTQFTEHQMVIVSKKSVRPRDKTISLQDWIAEHQFTAFVLSVNDNLIEVAKLDSETLYFKANQASITLNTASDEYDIQPLRTEPFFQSDAMAIAML